MWRTQENMSGPFILFLVWCGFLLSFPAHHCSWTADARQLEVDGTHSIKDGRGPSGGKMNHGFHGGRRRLLGSDRGFGYGSGATGGDGGSVIYVENLKDSGVESLRWACSQPGPVVIEFKVSGTISVNSPILCLSDRTIDGRGQEITLKGQGIEINGQSNVIIRGLCILNSKMDAIAVHSSKNVWIDKVSISKANDGAVDMVRASSGLTVSHCHFANQVKTMLIGNDDGGSEDKVQTVTLYANYFENCVSRMPRVRYGTAHVCSNVFKHWERYVLGASNDGRILAENNYFIAGSDTQIDHFHAPDPDDSSIISFRGSRLYGAIQNSKEEDRFGIPFSCPALAQNNIISEAGAGSWCAI